MSSSTSIQYINKVEFDQYLDKILRLTVKKLDIPKEMNFQDGQDTELISLELRRVWWDWRKTLTLAFFSRGGDRPESGKGPFVFRKLEWYLLEFLNGKSVSTHVGIRSLFAIDLEEHSVTVVPRGSKRLASESIQCSRRLDRNRGVPCTQHSGGSRYSRLDQQPRKRRQNGSVALPRASFHSF